MKKESWVEKIYTRNGIARDKTLLELKTLDIGCGQKKFPDSIGMDIVKNSQADIVHDASDIPWPFEENSFDMVIANHFVEHIDDLLVFFNEAHRILKQGGRIIIQVPYFRKTDAFTDITHRHLFTSQSLDYIIKDAKLSAYNYTDCLYAKVGFWYGWPSKSKNPITALFKRYITKYPKFYDQYLSLLLPMPCLTWELEVIK